MPTTDNYLISLITALATASAALFTAITACFICRQATLMKRSHDSGILLEILRRSRDNYPIRTQLRKEPIDWDDYDKKYPKVYDKITNETWYKISETGSFFGLMGTMVKYKYVNPDV